MADTHNQWRNVAAFIEAQLALKAAHEHFDEAIASLYDVQNRPSIRWPKP